MNDCPWPPSFGESALADPILSISSLATRLAMKNRFIFAPSPNLFIKHVIAEEVKSLTASHVL